MFYILRCCCLVNHSFSIYWLPARQQMLFEYIRERVRLRMSIMPVFTSCLYTRLIYCPCTICLYAMHVPDMCTQCRERATLLYDDECSNNMPFQAMYSNQKVIIILFILTMNWSTNVIFFACKILLLYGARTAYILVYTQRNTTKTYMKREKMPHHWLRRQNICKIGNVVRMSNIINMLCI